MTDGSGQLTGATPTFFAPMSVDTLSLELRVSSGGTTSAPNTVNVNVLEHDGDAFFVDGASGDGVFTSGGSGGGVRDGQGGQGGVGGGPSFAILVGPSISPVITDNTLTSCQGGSGGGGGLGGRRATDGGDATASAVGSGCTSNATAQGPDGAPSEGGWSFGIFDLDPDDGMVPSVLDNSIEVG